MLYCNFKRSKLLEEAQKYLNKHSQVNASTLFEYEIKPATIKMPTFIKIERKIVVTFDVWQMWLYFSDTKLKIVNLA